MVYPIAFILCSIYGKEPKLEPSPKFEPNQNFISDSVINELRVIYKSTNQKE
jgi:hypothetical protein